MKPYVSIPRDALADLLRLAGSPLTPEQYLATLPQPDSVVYRKYAGRAVAAAFSKYFILVVAVLAVVSLPFLGFSVENIIITVGLVTVTYFEFRVHKYFLEYNPAGPSLGFRNQTCFAAAIVIYCLYHAFQPVAAQIPAEYREVMDPNTTGMVQTIERITYLVIAIVAGGSQYGLAWYYRLAKVDANP
jgi:hypothetical protein